MISRHDISFSILLAMTTLSAAAERPNVLESALKKNQRPAGIAE
jgi:hypothetical protein